MDKGGRGRGRDREEAVQTTGTRRQTKRLIHHKGCIASTFLACCTNSEGERSSESHLGEDCESYLGRI